MDRRKFLQSGSLAVLAVATLPKAVRSMGKENVTSSYRSKADPNVQTQTFYEVVISHNAIENFDNATTEEKVIMLKVAVIASATPATPSQQGQFKYVITNVKKGDNDVWTVTTKFDSKVSGDYTFEKGFPADLKLHCREFNNVEILDKKGKKVLQNLDYYIPPATTTGSGGCFITTACVQHKQLADDCDTLTTLRYLRDSFIKQNEEGNQMIGQYQITGPAIVAAIDSCDNKAAIYDHMYTQMILPAVELVKQHQLQQAIDHYKTFVKALVNAYL